MFRTMDGWLVGHFHLVWLPHFVLKVPITGEQVGPCLSVCLSQCLECEFGEGGPPPLANARPLHMQALAAVTTAGRRCTSPVHASLAEQLWWVAAALEGVIDQDGKPSLRCGDHTAIAGGSCMGACMLRSRWHAHPPATAAVEVVGKLRACSITGGQGGPRVAGGAHRPPAGVLLCTWCCRERVHTHFAPRCTTITAS